MTIPKKYTPFILTALVFMVLAIGVCLYGLARVSDFEWDIKNQQTSHVTSDPDLLNSNVDTSDWVEYESDVYGYSILLPKEAVLIDEYYGKQLPFDPKGTFFLAKLNDYVGLKQDYSEMEKITLIIFPFSGKIGITDFINKDSKEAGKRIITKVLSVNGVDYYKREIGKGCNSYIAHKDIVAVNLVDCTLQDEYYKAILKNIKFK